MKKFEQKLIDRITQLENMAERVKGTHKPSPPNTIGFPTLDEDVFNEWKVSSENIIIRVAGKDSSYYENFLKTVKGGYKDHVNSGIGILRALREDMKLDLLVSLQSLVKAEVFTDFLEIAEHLLDNNYKDPAASLIGAVLENGLKDIASNNSVTCAKSDGIFDINKKLAAAGVYTALVHKQVDLWRDIRNSADHGNFADYTLDDVKNMKTSVENFLSVHI